MKTDPGSTPHASARRISARRTRGPRPDTHGALVGVVDAVANNLFTEQAQYSEPQVCGHVEGRPQQRGPEWKHPALGTAESLDVVREVEVSVEEDRMQLHKVSESVAGRALIPHVEQH